VTVHNLVSGVLLSLTQIATEFGSTRETVAKRLSEAGVEAAGKRGGHPVYRLRDVIAPVLSLGDERADPERLKPHEREAHYRGELARLRLRQETRELVPRVECQQELASAFKIFVEFAEGLPDVIERDAGAPVAVLNVVEREVDRMRERLHARVTGSTLGDASNALDEAESA
jgi:hypothetical protein